MSNIKALPFSEIVERVQDLGRANAETKSRIRGIVNEVYTNDIPNSYEWHWLKASSAISCIAEVDSGIVHVTTQDTIATFSGVTIESSMTGRKIKFSDNSDVYDVTYLNSTGFTISPPLSGATSVSSGAYKLYKNIYSLPSDFDRFPVNGGLLFYSAGQPMPLPQVLDDDYYARVNASPSSQPEACRFAGFDTAGALQVEVLPPPSVAYILRNEFLRALPPMRETTAGTIVVGSGASLVGGTSTLFATANTGDYIRADAFGRGVDSMWYRVIAVTNNTTLTISPVFRTDSGYSGSYTLCSAPEIPYRMQHALIYGGLEKILPDHKDPVFLMAHMQFAKILTDNKIIEQSRFAKDDIELISEDSDYRW